MLSSGSLTCAQALVNYDTVGKGCRHKRSSVSEESGSRVVVKRQVGESISCDTRKKCKMTYKPGDYTMVSLTNGRKQMVVETHIVGFEQSARPSETEAARMMVEEPLYKSISCLLRLRRCRCDDSRRGLVDVEVDRQERRCWSCARLCQLCLLDLVGQLRFVNPLSSSAGTSCESELHVIEVSSRTSYRYEAAFLTTMRCMHRADHTFARRHSAYSLPTHEEKPHRPGMETYM